MIPIYIDQCGEILIYFDLECDRNILNKWICFWRSSKDKKKERKVWGRN